MPWFEESGGGEPLAKRLLGLDDVLAKPWVGKSVLDLGGAEGLIAGEFAKRGASAVVVDRDAPTRARRSRVRFTRHDLNEPIEFGQRRFDLVLALSVAQKLKDPAAFLRWAGSLGRTLVVRTPGETFRRKGYPTSPAVSVRSTLKGIADLVDEPATFPGAWMGVFEVKR